MSYIREALIVEDKIEELLNKLPVFINPTTLSEHFHTFKKGPENEINAFLSKKKECYPLIWLAYPFIESHSKRKVSVKDITIIIAVPGDVSTFLDDRFNDVYKNVLYKIFNNIIYLLEKSSNVKLTSDVSVTKFPNYSETKKTNSANPIDVWDAIKVNFDLIINDTKLNF